MANAYRVRLVRTRIAEPSEPLNSPHAVVRHYGKVEQLDREHLIRLDLDNKNRLIGEETVSIGTAHAALISPREVFRGAILNGASRIIVLHNHPSGDPDPSPEDREIARRLGAAADLVAIPLIDFLIIGENGQYHSVDLGDPMSGVDENCRMSGRDDPEQEAER
jgi:DNA repair protein RadC